ncbi:DUF397 domain-containing protein [Streptomyces sp. NPDC001339]|uniref:DUF397 domain-containing protein n=1 Tax=Streptomyces sp. NPDC001339 TaxID=3364563 RepID=UPI003697649A
MSRNLDQGASGWRKSSYSAERDECVETGTFPVTHPAGPTIAVRDTKHHRTGPVVAFTADAWSAFLAEIKKT